MEYVVKLRSNDFEAGVNIDWLFSFRVTGTSHRIVLKLPVFFLKFAAGASMNAQDFFNRWKQLSRYLFVNIMAGELLVVNSGKTFASFD